MCPFPTTSGCGQFLGFMGAEIAYPALSLGIVSPCLHHLVSLVCGSHSHLRMCYTAPGFATWGLEDEVV